MRVIISGASGFIGTALTRELTARGDVVVPLVRRPAAAGEIRWDPAKGDLDVGSLAGADVVVNLAGAGIGDHRWTDAYKREVRESRLQSTRLLADGIAVCPAPPPVFLSGSAVGAYGASDDRELDETSPLGEGFLADVCRQWEQATEPAALAGARVAYLRSGIVLDAHGGALKKMLPLYRIGLGGRLGKGAQWQSWISLADEIGAIIHLMTAPVSGPVNLTAPNPVTGKELARTLGAVLHRPSVTAVPAFGPRLLLGRELADALLFTGQRVLPRALQRSGYEFRHATLERALRAALEP